MKSKTEILNLLKQYKPKAQREYGLTRLGAMGSGTFAPTDWEKWEQNNIEP